MAPPPDKEPGNGAQSSCTSPEPVPDTPKGQCKEVGHKGNGDKGREKSGPAKDCGKSPCVGTGGATSGGQSGGGTSAGGKRASGVWHPGLQFALAIAVVLVVAVLVLFPPVYTSHLLVGAGIDTAGAMNIWAPMLAVLIGLTTVTISGIFLFMTFRIDRGTKRVARDVAAKEAKIEAARVAEGTAKTLHTRICKDRECAKSEIGRLKKKVECKLTQFKEVDQHVTKARQAANSVESTKKEVEETASEVRDKLVTVRKDAGEVGKALDALRKDAAGDDLRALKTRVDKLEKRLAWLPPWTLKRKHTGQNDTSKIHRS